MICKEAAMLKNEIEAREKIISATTRLIRHYGDTTKITVRDIAEKSGVGVGLINYHFQTKDKLINLCVQRIISQFLEEIERLHNTLDMTPIDKLRYIFKSMASYISANPGISRISMLTDLNLGCIGDNTDHSTRLHFKELKENWNGHKTDKEIYMLLHVIISSIQIAFLRNHILKENISMDFYDSKQRDEFIDALFDTMFLHP